MKKYGRGKEKDEFKKDYTCLNVLLLPAVELCTVMPRDTVVGVSGRYVGVSGRSDVGVVTCPAPVLRPLPFSAASARRRRHSATRLSVPRRIRRSRY